MKLPAANGASGKDARWRIGRCFFNRFLIALVVVGLLLVAFSNDAEAAKKRKRGSSRNRRAAATAKARKQQAVKSIQRQVAAARQVLVAAESQGRMSRSKVNQAISKLSKIHIDIENAHQDLQESAKTLHEVEAEIRSEQKPDSDLSRANAAMAKAKDDVNLAIHRVLRLPEDHGASVGDERLKDLAKLSPEQRKTLESDSSYAVARGVMKAAGREAEQIRRKVFRSDPEWVAARRDVVDAEMRSRKGSRQARTTGLGSLGDRQDLRKAKNVAAAARTVIARGEIRIRQLGGKKRPSPSSKKTKRK